MAPHQSCMENEEDVQTAAAALSPLLQLLLHGRVHRHGSKTIFFKQDSSFSCCKTFLSVHKTFHCLYAKKFHYRILLQQWCNPQWRINVYLVFAFTRLRAEHCFVRVWITHQSLWTCIASASIHCVIFKLSFLFYSPSYFIVFLSMWKWSSWMSISCLHLAIWKEKNT